MERHVATNYITRLFQLQNSGTIRKIPIQMYLGKKNFYWAHKLHKNPGSLMWAIAEVGNINVIACSLSFLSLVIILTVIFRIGRLISLSGNYFWQTIVFKMLLKHDQRCSLGLGMLFMAAGSCLWKRINRFALRVLCKPWMPFISEPSGNTDLTYKVRSHNIYTM